ncbi:alpha-amylase family protein [Cryptosporangium arvum]|uniref:alpha-amylase family protein n=1 Tax=Cryptosporangium arvum TaxID=80871 RepID=UPI0004BBB393|nr:alpha-amylase family protein [Cryptosporangium arvum]
MEWVQHAVWWHVYPLGFCGAPIRDPDPAPAPRLRRLLHWLDYAIELGTNGLLLGPVFTASTHGYDTLDHFAIDPRLGDADDFDALIAACRARGLRVVLDGVFSHVGRSHPDLVRVLREGPDAPGAGLFDIDWERREPRVFEGHDGLARLDHRSPAALDYTTRVLTHWLDRGIDGWRLDAAYSVDPAFWHEVLGRTRERHPGAWFLAEVIHGDYVAFAAASGVDAVTQYELWKAIWSSLADRNFYELDWSLQRHREHLRSVGLNTFVGNHDVTRIASTVGEDGALVALAVLLTVGGVPSIYYGDEQGFTGVKEERLGGDDAVRPAFPDEPGELAPWGERLHRAHQDLIGLRRRHPWLHAATTEALTLTNTEYTYRVSDGTDHLDVALTGTDVRVLDADGGTLWHS